jgi:hypothetical protein
MVSFISLSKFLLFINIASAFIMPPPLLPSVSHINKLPVKVNRYHYNNNNNIKMKLDNNVKVGIDIIGITTYSYLLSKCLNIYYPQSFIYSFILYNLTLFLISKLKDDTPE